MVIKKLNYSIGIFINIDSIKCFLGEYEGRNRDKLHEFCIKQIKGKSIIHYAHLQENELIIAEY